MQSRYDSDAGDGGETVTVSGTVKWFNAVKGFGFVSPSDGAADVFLHLSCLRDAGYDTAEEGASIVCEATRRPKGMQAVRVIQMDAAPAGQSVKRPPRPAFGGGGERAAPLAIGGFVDASVKWFNPIKGYGFLASNEVSQDIFVHIEVLRRVGVAELQPGQAVRVRIGDGPKGPQVAEIELP